MPQASTSARGHFGHRQTAEQPQEAPDNGRIYLTSPEQFSGLMNVKTSYLIGVAMDVSDRRNPKLDCSFKASQNDTQPVYVSAEDIKTMLDAADPKSKSGELLARAQKSIESHKGYIRDRFGFRF